MKTDAATINFRATIAAEQKRQRLTDYAIAKRAECSAEAYRKYLDGQRECRSDVLERIFTALGIKLALRD